MRVIKLIKPDERQRVAVYLSSFITFITRITGQTVLSRLLESPLPDGGPVVLAGGFERPFPHAGVFLRAAKDAENRLRERLGRMLHEHPRALFRQFARHRGYIVASTGRPHARYIFTFPGSQ